MRHPLVDMEGIATVVLGGALLLSLVIVRAANNLLLNRFR
jgi:hypothetical protein